MKTKLREEIITSMCYTWRHDYGIEKQPNASIFEAGMTKDERGYLWKQMAQLFDNDIAPHVILKETINE